jgi:ACR3 family arsenite efflux pump ArsB
MLGGLLYATFTQVPLTRIGRGMQDRRFLAALLLGNFVVILLIVGVFVNFLPISVAVKAGVLLVLLVPCTDWFISFTYLGKGDAGRAIAATPVLLLVQLLTLPPQSLALPGYGIISGHDQYAFARRVCGVDPHAPGPGLGD